MALVMSVMYTFSISAAVAEKKGKAPSNDYYCPLHLGWVMFHKYAKQMDCLPRNKKKKK